MKLIDGALMVDVAGEQTPLLDYLRSCPEIQSTADACTRVRGGELTAANPVVIDLKAEIVQEQIPAKVRTTANVFRPRKRKQQA